jgi:hypothetical protein
MVMNREYPAESYGACSERNKRREFLVPMKNVRGNWVTAGAVGDIQDVYLPRYRRQGMQ